MLKQQSPPSAEKIPDRTSSIHTAPPAATEHTSSTREDNDAAVQQEVNALMIIGETLDDKSTSR
jgi:hypothetical protein